MVDVVETVALLLSDAADNQAVGSYTLQRLRNFIVTMAAEAGLGTSLVTVAAAGTTQGTAATLTTYNTVVNSGTGGVKIMNVTFVVQRILNRSGTPIQVYPPSSIAIESLATNVAITLANGANLEISVVSAGVAYIVGGMGAPKVNMPTTPTSLGSGCEWRNGTIVNIV